MPLPKGTHRCSKCGSYYIRVLCTKAGVHCTGIRTDDRCNSCREWLSPEEQIPLDAFEVWLIELEEEQHATT